MGYACFGVPFETVVSFEQREINILCNYLRAITFIMHASNQFPITFRRLIRQNIRKMADAGGLIESSSHLPKQVNYRKLQTVEKCNLDAAHIFSNDLFLLRNLI